MEDCMTAHIDTQEAPEEGNTNGYNEKLWPYDQDWNSWAVKLTEVSYGASAIVRLLHADQMMQERIRNSDRPGEEAQPFNEYITNGLFAALNVCVSEIEAIAVDLSRCRVTRQMI